MVIMMVVMPLIIHNDGGDYDDEYEHESMSMNTNMDVRDEIENQSRILEEANDSMKVHTVF